MRKQTNPLEDNASTMLEAVSIGKKFPAREHQTDDLWVIRGLNFHIREGEFVTIVGPSGCGKSTILSMLAQVETPSEGQLVLRGEEVLNAENPILQPGLGCQIGYVTQDDNLLPWRTLLDNILFPLELQGRLNEETRAHAAELIETVGLVGYEHYYPHELSGGMRKRAALIRTLVYDPPVILLDEPFGALDAETRGLLQADLQRLWALKRKTILFVTHEIGEAVALGDRVLVLKRAPSSIVAEHIVDLPRPRVIDELLVQPSFVALYETIRGQIR